MTVAALEIESADIEYENSGETRSNSLQIEDTNDRAREFVEDPSSANYINAIALRAVPRVAPSSCLNKRKQEGLKDSLVSPKKRSKGVEETVHATKREAAMPGSPKVAAGKKLKRPTKVGRNSRRRPQLNQASREDIYTVPDDLVAHTGTASGPPINAACAPQSKSNASRRKKLDVQQVEQQSRPERSLSAPNRSGSKHRVTANMRSSRTQTSAVSKAASKPTVQENEDFNPSDPIDLTETPRLDAHRQQQDKSLDRLESMSRSTPRNLRSGLTIRVPQAVEVIKGRGSELEKRSHSSDGGRERDRAAMEEAENDHSDVASAEGEGLSDGEHIEGDRESIDSLLSDDSEQDSANKGAAVRSRQSSVENFLASIEPQLFGEADSWDTVLTEVQKVGVSNVKGERFDEKPELKTKTIEAMVATIEEVRSMYTKLLPHKGQHHVGQDEFDQRSAETLGKLMLEIEDLSEKAPGSNSQKIIQDVYAHAIPHLVKLLDVALRCRTEEYSQQHDTQVLQELIQLQQIVSALCKKARAWKVKPITTRPIIQPTLAIIPRLRDVRQAFQNELNERHRAERMKTAEKRRLRFVKKRDEGLRRQKEDIAKSILENRKRTAESLRQHEAARAALHRICQPGGDMNPLSALHDLQPRTFNGWTPQQDHELLQRLQWKSSRYLPGLQFYSLMIDAR